MQLNDMFLDNLPKIDLHGFDQASAKVATNDFINDSIKLNHEKILIIHGIGKGLVKEAVHEELSKNKNVLSYQLDYFNIGCTIVFLKKNDT